MWYSGIIVKTFSEKIIIFKWGGKEVSPDSSVHPPNRMSRRARQNFFWEYIVGMVEHTVAQKKKCRFPIHVGTRYLKNSLYSPCLHNSIFNPWWIKQFFTKSIQNLYFTFQFPPNKTLPTPTIMIISGFFHNWQWVQWKKMCTPKE